MVALDVQLSLSFLSWSQSALVILVDLDLQLQMLKAVPKKVEAVLANL